VISRYTDHAANERTYLAWVRTAIAVMAFGFLVEKFDLFLEVAAQSLSGKQPTALNQAVGDVAGLLLIVLGGAMMVVATMRFRQVAKDIDAADVRPGRGTRMDVTLVMLLLTLGGTLFAFLIYTVVRRMG
jgi:putative membrane protein